MVFFITTVVAVLLAILLDLPMLYMAAKPLLMLTLLLYFLLASRGYPGWRKYVVIALVFSWGGDVLLMWDDRFVTGLASFLLAHVFYIIAYQSTGAACGQLRTTDLLKVLAIGLITIGLIYPGLGGLLLPVMAYTFVLLTMALRAHKRRGATNTASFILVSVGAVLFVISDSLIAVNKFAFQLPAERLLVMSTYMAAQYMIVHGLLKHEQPG